MDSVSSKSGEKTWLQLLLPSPGCAQKFLLKPSFSISFNVFYRFEYSHLRGLPFLWTSKVKICCFSANTEEKETIYPTWTIDASMNNNTSIQSAYDFHPCVISVRNRVFPSSNYCPSSGKDTKCIYPAQSLLYTLSLNHNAFREEMPRTVIPPTLGKHIWICDVSIYIWNYLNQEGLQPPLAGIPEVLLFLPLITWIRRV